LNLKRNKKRKSLKKNKKEIETNISEKEIELKEEIISKETQIVLPMEEVAVEALLQIENKEPEQKPSSFLSNLMNDLSFWRNKPQVEAAEKQWILKNLEQEIVAVIEPSGINIEHEVENQIIVPKADAKPVEAEITQKKYCDYKI